MSSPSPIVSQFLPSASATVGAVEATTMARKKTGSSFGTLLHAQRSTASRRGRRIGATAMSVHHAKMIEPVGAVMVRSAVGPKRARSAAGRSGPRPSASRS